MTTDQLRSLREAIDAHLRGEKVEVRDLKRLDDPWQVTIHPLFDGLYSEYRPAPKEPLKRWVVLSENGLFDNSSVDKAGAESIAKRLKGSVIELTETSRQSFQREPLRFWVYITAHGNLYSYDLKEKAEAAAKPTGGRVAEFVEVVK